jgi:hypothetical protein
MSMAGIRIAVMAASLVCAFALMAPAAHASDDTPILLAKSGIILRESEDWKVIRTPSGRIIKKRKDPAAKARPKRKTPTLKQAPSPSTEAKGPVKKKQAAKTVGKKDRRLIFGAGALYNPLNESVGPIVTVRPLEGFGLALWHGSGDYNLSEFRAFGYSYVVPGLLLTHAGAGYLLSDEEATGPGFSKDIDATGGSVFGGLTLEIKKRVQITAEAYAARIKAEEYISGTRVKVTHGVIGATASIVVYIW